VALRISKVKSVTPKPRSYRELLHGVAVLLERARQGAAQSVNTIITSTYWEIGRRIVEHEQRGHTKAAYGIHLLDKLSDDLTARLGRGFSRRNVFLMRRFFLAHPIVQTPSAQLARSTIQIVQTPSAQFHEPPFFPLPWSHYVRLLTVEDPAARNFYESEALRGGWSFRQLDRQIATVYYERLSRSQKKLLAGVKAGVRIPDQEIKDPFVLEFLGLKDEYSETELEQALILQLEQFLLELGNDFAFISRQQRLRIGKQWNRVDLLFFHRRLRCLVIIDLKVGKFTHADAGQMNMYLNYAREHWTHPDENPPVGLILCSEKDDAVAHYATGNSGNRVLAREYKLKLPSEQKLVEKLKQTRQRFLPSLASS
jgi:predicted nuclease of restriction endonuclease-like (RecB) superfamily